MNAMAMTHCVLLSLGSNINQRDMLGAALASLDQGADILWLSGLYENRSINNTGPFYVNGVVVLKTFESLDALYRQLKQLEVDIGGQRSGLLCPIDIDIIAFKDFNGRHKGQALPLQPSTANDYIWRACQDLISLPLKVKPSHWKLMHWPEFAKWQECPSRGSSLAREYLDALYLSN